MFAHFKQIPSSNSISQPFQGNSQNQSSTSSSSNNIQSQHYQQQSQTYSNQQQVNAKPPANACPLRPARHSVSLLLSIQTSSNHSQKQPSRKHHSSTPTQIHLLSHRSCCTVPAIRWKAKRATLRIIRPTAYPAQRAT